MLVLAVAVAAASLFAPTARASGIEDGKRLLKDRQWAKAADAFRESLKSTPSRDASLGLAIAATEGRLADVYEDATRAASAALKQKPDDRELRLAYGYLFLARATVDPRFRADAQEQFLRLQKANPDDEDAAIGLARYDYFGGDYAGGGQRLDALIEKAPKNALARYWRGMLLFTEAKDALGAGDANKSTPLFEKAADQFDASVKADPSRAEAWLQLAYAAHYVASKPERLKQAEEAYLKALDADPADEAPIAGLRSLLNSSGRFPALLARLSKEKPKSAAVLRSRAAQAAADGKFDEAVEALRAYVAVARAPERAWVELGDLLREKKGDEAGAKKAYEEALRANPRFAGSETAVGWLTQHLLEKGREAATSYEGAKEVQKEYEKVLALSPQSLLGHNNVAFFLREAFNKMGRTHRDLFDACIAHYVAASDAIGEFSPSYLSLPYSMRHGYAQILNDTGIMFDSEALVPDLPKAEAYYRKAMEWTEYGYSDTYGNMMKLLEKQHRLQDALDFAEACAEGIKTPDGSPQMTFRGTAAGDAARLKKMLDK
jgi:tetratricopeptide (TPR) repeat protein